MNRLARLFAIMRKELLQLGRDRLTFGMIVGIPSIMILLFGYAINNDVRNLNAAVANLAETHLSRQFVAQLEQTQILNVHYTVSTAEQLEKLLRAGKISVGIYIPPDFDRRSIDSTRTAAQLLVDGADPTIFGVANQLANFRLGFDSTETGAPPVRNLEIRPFYNPERRTAVNIVPGLIGVILTLTMILFTAVAIVREREHGNLELLINTPVSTTELMIGKVVPYIAIGLVQLALIVMFGKLLFDVPVRGGLLELYVGAAAFIAANLALGLLISTVARTQFQAMQMTFFLLLPSILLSGFVFPFDGMPPLAQFLGELLPNTHFIRVTRGIMLRNASIVDVGKEIAVLAGFAVVALTLAILRFSRRLD